MSRAVDPAAWKSLNPTREFTLFNATDDPVTIMYDGETKVIPPSNVVIYPHPKFSDVCHSAKDSKGNWIPGTLVLHDVYDTKEMGEFGESRNLWSAANAIKHCLGIDVRTGQASGDYARRGLSVLPPSPEPELVKGVYADGRSRYEEWRVKQAQEAIDAYDEKNAARSRVNMQPIPPGADYQKHVSILRAYQKKQESQMLDSMTGYDQQVFTPEIPGTSQEAVAPPDPEVPVQLEDHIARLLENPETIKILKEKHRMWTHGEKKKPLEA